MKIACVNCRQAYPDSGVPYKCPNCGGLYDYVEPFALNVQLSTLNPLSLGEGNTPLLSVNVFGREVYFKCEYLNPSGSFKDRGTATLVSFLRSAEWQKPSKIHQAMRVRRLRPMPARAESKRGCMFPTLLQAQNENKSKHTARN